MHATRQSMTYTTVSGVIIHLLYMRGKLQINSLTCLQVIDELGSFPQLPWCCPNLSHYLSSISFSGISFSRAFLSLYLFCPCFRLIKAMVSTPWMLQILSPHFIIFLSTRALLNIPRWRSYQLLKTQHVKNKPHCPLMPNHLFVLTSLTLSVTSPTSSPPRHSNNNKSSHVMGTWVLYLCCFQKPSTTCRAGSLVHSFCFPYPWLTINTRETWLPMTASQQISCGHLWAWFPRM